MPDTGKGIVSDPKCGFEANLFGIPLNYIQNSMVTKRGPLEELQEFNTKLHSLAEIKAVLPQFDHCPPESQPRILIEPFLPIMLGSSGCFEREAYKIQLPDPYLVRLAKVIKSVRISGHLSNTKMENLGEFFPRRMKPFGSHPDRTSATINFLADICTLFPPDVDIDSHPDRTSATEDFLAEICTLFPHQRTPDVDIDSHIKDNLAIHWKYYVRLDTCCLRDTVHGFGEAKSIDDLSARLATSVREAKSLLILRKRSPESSINMWLLPWVPILPTLKYRVFCPPPHLRPGEPPGSPNITRITAVSQCKLNKEWGNAPFGPWAVLDVKEMLQYSQNLMKMILQSLGMTEDLRTQGFVFDVGSIDRGLPDQLIDVQNFGAMTGCESCLFHWVRDAKLLYGFEELVEVRVVI